jgi:hypothetical protein
MDTDSANTESSPCEATAPAKNRSTAPNSPNICRQPDPIAKAAERCGKWKPEFRSTTEGIRIIMRNMADFQSVKSHFDSRNLSYYSFPKSENP